MLPTEKTRSASWEHLLQSSGTSYWVNHVFLRLQGPRPTSRLRGDAPGQGQAQEGPTPPQALLDPTPPPGLLGHTPPPALLGHTPTSRQHPSYTNPTFFLVPLKSVARALTHAARCQIFQGWHGAWSFCNVCPPSPPPPPPSPQSSSRSGRTGATSAGVRLRDAHRIHSCTSRIHVHDPQCKLNPYFFRGTPPNVSFPCSCKLDC